MGDRQDQLPVVQHALAQLWSFAGSDAGNRPTAPRTITIAHAANVPIAMSKVAAPSSIPDRLRWVTDAISTHADQVLNSLTHPVEARRQRDDDRPADEIARRPLIARRMLCALSQIDNNDEPERRLSSIEEVSKIVFGPEPTDDQRREVKHVLWMSLPKKARSFVSPSFNLPTASEALDISHESLCCANGIPFGDWLQNGTRICCQV